jgi:hypothetical protein
MSEEKNFCETQIKGWKKVKLFLFKLWYLQRMGIESVVIFILKLCAEKRPEVIFTLRFLYLQTKNQKCPLNRRLVTLRVNRDALEKNKIICTCQESKQDISAL